MNEVLSIGGGRTRWTRPRGEGDRSPREAAGGGAMALRSVEEVLISICLNAQNFRNRWGLGVNNVEIDWGTKLAGLSNEDGSAWVSP